MSRLEIPNLHRFARNLRPACAAAIFGTMVAFPSLAQDASAPVGTINGMPITMQDLDYAVTDLGDQLGQVPPEQRKIAALMALIDIKLLAEKAAAEKLDETDEFKQRMAFLRDRALHNTIFKKNVVDTITEADIRARYDAEIANTPPENEVRARHILLKTQEEAVEVIKELDGGADFAELAKQKSTGPTGPNGGDLDYVRRGQMVPEFDAAVFSMDVGTYSKEPVQTQFGWHVIKIEDIRPVQPPAFEQVAGQIRDVLLRERYFALMQDLRKNAKVDLSDADLKTQYDEALKQGAQ